MYWHAMISYVFPITKLVNYTHIFHGSHVRCMKGLNANDKVFLHIARILSCKTRRKDKGSMRTAAIVKFKLELVRGSVAILQGVRGSQTLPLNCRMTSKWLCHLPILIFGAT